MAQHNSVKEADIMYVESEGLNQIQITSPQVYTLLTMASITEEAYVEVQELDSEPDNLHEVSEYDPAVNEPSKNRSLGLV